MEKEIELIKKLSNAFGPSGHEDDVVEIIKDEVSSFMDCNENSMRCLFLNYFNQDNTKPTVVVDAHSDEVGFMVQAIRPDGLIEFCTIGGFVPASLPNSKVKILNENGKFVSGIISTIPPHFSHEAQSLDIPSMTIDLGARSRDEVMEKFGVHVGNFGVPDVICNYDEEHDLFFGKAFDCRIGIASLIKTLKDLKDTPLDVNLKAAISSQEEVGERGVVTSANYLKPDLVICFEGCPSDDTFTPEYRVQAGIKRGSMIRHLDVSVIPSPRFMKFAKDTAKECNIPLQESVRRGGGNNGAIYINSNNGVPTIVIGVPVRYIHTPNCICSYYDYEKASELATAIIKRLNKDIIKSF